MTPAEALSGNPFAQGTIGNIHAVLALAYEQRTANLIELLNLAGDQHTAELLKNLIAERVGFERYE